MQNFECKFLKLRVSGSAETLIKPKTEPLYVFFLIFLLKYLVAVLVLPNKVVI